MPFSSAQIDFDPQDVDFDVEERLRFWAALRLWFQQHGYYLYSHSHEEDGSHCYSYPQMMFSGKDEFPFAHLGDESLRNRPAFSLSDHLNVCLSFSCDETNSTLDYETRHVLISPRMLKVITLLLSWSRVIRKNTKSIAFWANNLHNLECSQS